MAEMTLPSEKPVLHDLNTTSGTSLEVRIGTVKLQTDVNILPCLTWLQPRVLAHAYYFITKYTNFWY